MIEIIPAIMPQSLDDLKEKSARVVGHAKTIQIDVMDGFFVPGKTWPYYTKNSSEFKNIVEGNEGLPYWDKVDYEVDLMVTRPEKAVFDWADAGVSRIIIHLESSENIRSLIGKIRKQYGNFKESLVSIEVGVAVSHGTPIEKLEELIDTDSLDFVQVMGIKKIGYQGEAFAEETIDIVSTLRNKYPVLIISVDGGVNFDNALAIAEAGANRLVSGSVIFQDGIAKESIKEFEEILK